MCMYGPPHTHTHTRTYTHVHKTTHDIGMTDTALGQDYFKCFGQFFFLFLLLCIVSDNFDDFAAQTHSQVPGNVYV